MVYRECTEIAYCCAPQLQARVADLERENAELALKWHTSAKDGGMAAGRGGRRSAQVETLRAALVACKPHVTSEAIMDYIDEELDGIPAPPAAPPTDTQTLLAEHARLMNRHYVASADLAAFMEQHADNKGLMELCAMAAHLKECWLGHEPAAGPAVGPTAAVGMTLTRDQLERYAATHKPPQSWYDEDHTGLYAAMPVVGPPLECGVEWRDGFHEFGVKEVNDAIASGRRVTKISTSVICHKVGETGENVRMAYTGCRLFVEFAAPPPEPAAAPPIAEWLEIPGYACNQCGAVARRNPKDNHEWGCARCNGSSHSVALNFSPVAEPAAAAEPPPREAWDDPVCKRCRDGHEPTTYCDHCAQERAAEADRAEQAAREESCSECGWRGPGHHTRCSQYQDPEPWN